MSGYLLRDEAPTFVSVPLRSSLTACLVGAMFGLLAGFTSIMALFLGRTDGTVSDLLLMQLLGLAILGVPWATYRVHWFRFRPGPAGYWMLIPKWLTASLIVTIGTALSGFVALLVVAETTGRSFGLADYLPALSILAYSVLWVDCYVGRRKLVPARPQDG